jgi:hypothetical protein
MEGLNAFALVFLDPELRSGLIEETQRLSSTRRSWGATVIVPFEFRQALRRLAGRFNPGALGSRNSGRRAGA